MKAAVIVRPGQLEIRDIPVPEIQDYQVFVEQLACGICTGTDWKLLEGHFKGFNTYPAVLGHEAVGRVTKMGKKVRYFEIGDLVLRPGLETIGGGTSLYSGWGAFAEYGVAGDGRAMIEDGKVRPEDGWNDIYLSQQKIPKEMDPAHGTMLITFKEVLSAIYRFGMRPNASLMIFGMGPVGLSFVRFTKILGLGPIIACDMESARLDLAREMGADECLDVRNTKPEAWAKARFPEGLDFIVDAVGITDLLNQAMNIIKFNGSICAYGISPRSQMNLVWENGPYNWKLHFLQWPTFQEESATHHQILNWIQMGVLDAGKFVTHVLPLDRLQEGLNLVRERKALKAVINLKT
ncbi:MAG TPA: zinc-binding dehydrogenase [Thermodesulfobacteriota bacterium]|nr:zinc-binding dehydrogenase [Thermodesulfobacteriota bacterium]